VRRPVIVEWHDAFADRSDEAHIEEEPTVKRTMGWLRTYNNPGTCVLVHEYDSGATDLFYTTIPSQLVTKVTYLEEVEK
jgi:hypothetical protein